MYLLCLRDFKEVPSSLLAPHCCTEAVSKRAGYSAPEKELDVDLSQQILGQLSFGEHAWATRTRKTRSDTTNRHVERDCVHRLNRITQEYTLVSHS